MKSGLRRLVNRSGPPIPMAPNASGMANMFNLRGGTASMESYIRAYRRSGTVFSIVSLLQNSAAGDWHLYRKQRDGRVRYSRSDTGSDERIEVLDHAALTLWNSPNDFHTGFEFREGSNQHLELTGETLWVLNLEATGFPTSMWYVRPDRMTPIPSKDDYLLGWIYRGPGGEQIPLELDEVIQEKMPDPEDPFRGMGPVAAILPNIEQQDYATQYQRNLFLNGADPGSVITMPSKMTDREWREFTERWRESHQGIARAGRVAVLENGATWAAPAGTNNKDMEYNNLRLANRDEIREAWRMHKSMLGTVEDVNRANAETAEEVFSTWMRLPRLERRKETLNTKLLPKFGAAGKNVEFDFADSAPINQEAANQEMLAKANAAKALIEAGYEPHAVLEVVGLPDMEVVERATQLPAIAPPGWGSGQVGGTEGGESGDGGGPASGDQNHDPHTGKFTTANRDSYTLSSARPQVTNKDAKARALSLLASDYPAEAIVWAHDAEWTGPVKMPESHFKPNDKEMDLVDPNLVADFIRDLEDGKKLSPIIAVKTPGHDRPLIVDGHHRYLAYRQMQLPVRAMIGKVDSDHGGWEGMHDRQTHHVGSMNYLSDFFSTIVLNGHDTAGRLR